MHQHQQLVQRQSHPWHGTQATQRYHQHELCPHQCFPWPCPGCLQTILQADLGGKPQLFFLQDVCLVRVKVRPHICGWPWSQFHCHGLRVASFTGVWSPCQAPIPESYIRQPFQASHSRRWHHWHPSQEGIVDLAKKYIWCSERTMSPNSILYLTSIYCFAIQLNVSSFFLVTLTVM